jgi:hypothetical protein
MSFDKQSISFSILDLAFSSSLPITIKIAFNILMNLADCSSFLIESNCFERFSQIIQLKDDELYCIAFDFFSYLMESYQNIDLPILDSIFEIANSTFDNPLRQHRTLHILNSLFCKNDHYVEIFCTRHPFEQLLELFNGSFKVKKALLWLFITIALDDQFHILCHPIVISELISILDVNSPQLILYVLRSLKSIFIYQRTAPPNYQSLENVFEDHGGCEKLMEMLDTPDQEIQTLITQILLILNKFEYFFNKHV